MMSEDTRSGDRQKLLTALLEAVKQCQTRFGGRAELAAESDSRVAVLCRNLEAVLSHGLRQKPLSKNSSAFRQVTEIVSNSLHLSRFSSQEQLVLWHFVREHLTKHEYERYLLLKHVWTDVGRGRAWLRSALNEHSLERYLQSFLANTALITVFYEDWSFFQDQERNNVLPNIAAGLGSILFAISIDNVDLNSSTGKMNGEISPMMAHAEPVITTLSTSLDSGIGHKQELRRRKRVPAHIISFDDDPEVEEATETKSEVSGIPTQHGNSPIISSEEVRSDSPAKSRKDSRSQSNSVMQTLTPVNNMNVGELIPCSATDEAHSEEDSISVPSYSEDTDCAAAALLATQKLLQANCVQFPGQLENNSCMSNSTGDILANLHAELRFMKQQLQETKDGNVLLQAQLSEEKRLYTDKVERLEARVQALVRENELLKHQLRKYVGAVQMLKRDGTQAHEALARLEALQSKPDPDYHFEAREYEKKLIQVAEMHGELMEFNERLQRLLQAKDGAIRRLKDELVDLRGPLPDDLATSDDDVSVTSDYDNSSLCAAARALINIWIPSAFLTGGSSDVHHVYQVFIRIRDDEWNIYRRYAQFYSLHKELKKKDPVFSTFVFPPKKTIGNKDARFVEDRRRGLQHYLRCVMNHLVQSNAELAAAPDKDMLIGLMPFFGETCHLEDKGKRKRGSSRNPFSRLGRSSDANVVAEQPHYTGL